MPALERGQFESLFRSHFQPLCLLAVRYVKDMDTARNIVQEAFINLWEKRETIDPDKGACAYLSTAVRNRSLNHLRDNRKFSQGLLALEEVLPETTDMPRLSIDTAELAQRIAAAMAELPERCREVFLLSRNEHLKYQEIADRLGISVKTVETQMSKALQHMRLRLQDYLMILALLASGYYHPPV